MRPPEGLHLQRIAVIEQRLQARLWICACRKKGCVATNGTALAQGGRRKKAASKTKYTCRGSGRNAWAKPGSALICGECYDDGKGEIRIMDAEG